MSKVINLTISWKALHHFEFDCSNICQKLWRTSNKGLEKYERLKWKTQRNVFQLIRPDWKQVSDMIRAKTDMFLWWMSVCCAFLQMQVKALVQRGSRRWTWSRNAVVFVWNRGRRVCWTKEEGERFTGCQRPSQKPASLMERGGSVSACRMGTVLKGNHRF